MRPWNTGWRKAALGATAVLLSTLAARANPTLVMDVDSGEVLYQEMATAPWYPASLTKLMTTYVALSKVREGKMSLDTPLRVSAFAATMAPSKMGFRPGTLVTLDNALKMLMVKSPNDIAVTIAEGVSGSMSGFADEMNAYAAKLGLRESRFHNPNGLPDPDHVSSARDMAIIGRALFREFPEEHDLFGIPALTFGGRIINNHNALLGRYPGVDGMKTGYTCSAGYNVVASAQRGNKHLIVVILGAPSGRERSERAATLFERFFSNPTGSDGDVGALRSSEIVMPPDLRGQICGPGRRNLIAEAEADDAAIALAPATPTVFGKAAERTDLLNLAAGALTSGTTAVGAAAVATPGKVELLGPRAAFQPVRVFIGPVAGWTGPIAGPGPVEVGAPGPHGRIAVQAPVADRSLQPVASGTAPGEALATPLALAGAVPPTAALTAANRVVKSKGRLSMRAPGRVPAASKPIAVAPPKARPKPVAGSKPLPSLRKAAGKTKPKKDQAAAK